MFGMNTNRNGHWYRNRNRIYCRWIWDKLYIFRFRKWIDSLCGKQHLWIICRGMCGFWAPIWTINNYYCDGNHVIKWDE